MQLMQSGGCPPAPTPNQSPATVYYNSNNQVTFVNQSAPSSMSMPGGFAYDSAGNVTQDNQNQYLYDAEGRICAVSNTPLPGMTTLTGYIYNAAGSRVSKGTITTMSCDPAIAGFTPTNDFILGPGGEQETEVGWDANNTLAWQHTNVFAGSRLVATYDNDGLHFHVTDPLGTRRVQTDYAGVVEQTCQNLPFGDALACTNSSQYPTEHHFTGKERDTESGNDYFGARYFGSSMGRFMSPDPLGPWGAKATDPQSWNFYAYGRNNPLINIDPTGLDCIYFGDTSGTVSEIDHGNSAADAQECANNVGGQWVNGYTTENQMYYNSDTDSWNVASSDQNNVYYTTISQADPTCTTNCQTGYSQFSLNSINSMMVAGSMSDFLQWLPANGIPNSRPNAQYPLSPWIQAADMQLLGSFTNYCGPNGAGVPVSGNDWACATHDYNFNKIGAGGLAPLFGPNNPNILNTDALRRADKNLVNNLDNSPEGLVIKAAFHLTRY